MKPLNFEIMKNVQPRLIAALSKMMIMMLAMVAITFASCSKDLYYQVLDINSDAPPRAASSKAWVFGEQTWSDAIRIPECNEKTFENSDTEPQCRSYTEDSNTWYYYNWPYVDANAATLCPTPWRVPTRSDFEALILSSSAAILCTEWGYGGYTTGSTVSSMTGVSTHASYWSSEMPLKFDQDSEKQIPDPKDVAYLLNYHSGYCGVPYDVRRAGLLIRCVK
ncbi:MAG: fibrobacter succinogenes major paralogous domain-containing protein [Prevotellaceae bacterium]|jgi:hypothetical protein|nr:fibrobacter succinogenes major paralogous domain-containing protein [Prevotellaceae bacterium]